MPFEIDCGGLTCAAAPLLDANGTCVFFLGGQINCSTTVHNASDIIRILSFSGDVNEEKEAAATVAPAPRNTSFGNTFLRPFRSNNVKTPPANRQIGMETDLISRIEKMNLRKQMDLFYTAYSKVSTKYRASGISQHTDAPVPQFLVISYDTFFISFYSKGIVEMLFPSKPTTAEIFGSDIFKFLTHHANSVPREYKSRVKNQLKAGQAISLELTLCTRRFMGFERFITHWTPLKNEDGTVHFVILTLGSLQA